MKTCMVALIIRWCSTSEHTLGVEKTRGSVMKRKEGDKPEKHRMKHWMCSKCVVLLRESQWKSVSKQWKSGQGSEGRSGLDSTEKPGSLPLLDLIGHTSGLLQLCPKIPVGSIVSQSKCLEQPGWAHCLSVF